MVCYSKIGRIRKESNKKKKTEQTQKKETYLLASSWVKASGRAVTKENREETLVIPKSPEQKKKSKN